MTETTFLLEPNPPPQGDKAGSYKNNDAVSKDLQDPRDWGTEKHSRFTTRLGPLLWSALASLPFPLPLTQNNLDSVLPQEGPLGC